MHLPSARGTQIWICLSITLSTSLILAITRKRASLGKRPEGSAASDSIAPATRSDVCSLCSSFSCAPTAPPLTHQPQTRNLSLESTASICLAADTTLFTHFDAVHRGAHVRSQMKQHNTLLAWPRRPSSLSPWAAHSPTIPTDTTRAQCPTELRAPRGPQGASRKHQQAGWNPLLEPSPARIHLAPYSTRPLRFLVPLGQLFQDSQFFLGKNVIVGDAAEVSGQQQAAQRVFLWLGLFPTTCWYRSPLGRIPDSCLPSPPPFLTNKPFWFLFFKPRLASSEPFLCLSRMAWSFILPSILQDGQRGRILHQSAR